MNRTYLSALSLALAAMAAGNAFATDAAGPKTRAQVQAELADAQRTGDIVHGDSGQKLNELFPSRYPAKAAPQGLSRAQVQAELAEAQRTGDIVHGDSGQKLNELFPNRYPAKAATQGLTRAQVQATLAEARRTGEYELINNQGSH